LINVLIFSLIQIIAVLPATSVDCERGFSTLNRIKADLRSKLEDHLESLMRISSTNMDVSILRREYAEALIQKWRNRKERRSRGKGDTLAN
jgi:hypothetical protein